MRPDDGLQEVARLDGGPHPGDGPSEAMAPAAESDGNAEPWAADDGLPETVAISAFGQDLMLAAPRDMFLRDDTIWRLREIYEPALSAQRIDPTGVALDIGAGFGGFAIPFALAFPGWTVWCFEPEPVAYAMLCRNAKAQGLTNLVALNIAVCHGHVDDPTTIEAALLACGQPDAPGAFASLLALCPQQDFRRHRDLRGVIERGTLDFPRGEDEPPADALFEPCRFPALPAAALGVLKPALVKLTAPHAEAGILDGLAAVPLDNIVGEIWTQVPSRLVNGRGPGRHETWLPMAGSAALKLRRGHDLTGRHPGLDVVVAMFNSEPFIVECIEGILSSVSDEIRVLVVDDGSTDGSADLVRAGYGDDPRVKLLHKQNGGCASARNHGRLASRARHIAFVDADDVPGPGMFDELLELARYTGAEVVQGAFVLLHGDGEDGRRLEPSTETHDPAYAHLPRFPFGTGQFCTVPAPLMVTGQPSIWRRVYRRDFLDQRRIWFPEHIRAFDDQLFQLMTLHNVRSVPMLDHVHYGYRQHAGQDIRQGDERAFYSLEMFRLMLKRLLAEGTDDLHPFLRAFANTVNWSWSTLRPDLRPDFVRAAAELWVYMQKSLPPHAFRDVPDSAILMPDFGHYTMRLHDLLRDLGPSHGWAYLDGIDMHAPMVRSGRR